MTRRYIEFYIIMGLLTLSVLILLIGKYYLGWFATNETVYAKYSDLALHSSVKNNVQTSNLENEINQNVTMQPEIIKESKTVIIENEYPIKKESSNKISIESIQKFPVEIKKVANDIPSTINKKELPKSKVINHNSTPIKVVSNQSQKREYSFSDQHFHSLGEFVSIDERSYRFGLIDNLEINTIIIDRLSKGNGVSHEFFKVAYQTNMIPAKVLIDIVESKEFRDLIPQEYIKRERETELNSGEKIVFNADSIKRLLILWGEGKLTPVQKVWLVGAGK